MNSEWHFTQDRTTLGDVLLHLSQCDPDFVPALSSRVRIAEYAEKLVSNATRFEAWREGALIALIAVYCNNREQRRAYISNISVLADSQHRGLGACLLKRCLEYLQLQEFEGVELQVDRRNNKAISLYERHGFKAGRSDGWTITMSLDQRGTGG